MIVYDIIHRGCCLSISLNVIFAEVCYTVHVFPWFPFPFHFLPFFRIFFSSKHILHTCFQHTTTSVVWTHKEWLFFFPQPLLHLFNAFLHRFYFFDNALCDVIVCPFIFLNTSWWRFVLSLFVFYAAYFLSLPYLLYLWRICERVFSRDIIYVSV